MVRLIASMTQEKAEAIVNKWLLQNGVQGSLYIKEAWGTCEIDADFVKDGKEYSVHFTFDRTIGFCTVILYEVIDGYRYCRKWRKEIDFLDGLEEVK